MVRSSARADASGKQRWLQALATTFAERDSFADIAVPCRSANRTIPGTRAMVSREHYAQVGSSPWRAW